MNKRYAVTIGGRLTAAGLQTVILALLARALGVDDFGVFAVTSAATLLIMGLLELGSGTVALRISEAERTDGTLSLITLLRLVSGVVILLAAWVAAPAAGIALPTLAIASVCYVIGESAGDLAVGVLQGSRRPWRAVSALIARRFAVLVPLLAAPTTEGAVASLAIGAGTGALVLLLIAVSAWSRPLSFVEYLRSYRGIIFTSLASNANQLDTVIVTGVGGIYLAGLYGAAARLSNSVNVAVSSLVQVLIPELRSVQAGGDQVSAFRRARRIALGLASTIAASAILAPAIVQILFGPDFADAAPILAGVLVAAGITAVSQIYMSWFFAFKVPRIVVIGTYVGLAVGIAAIATLGAFFGTMGLAIAIIIWRATTASFVIGTWHYMNGNH